MSAPVSSTWPAGAISTSAPAGSVSDGGSAPEGGEALPRDELSSEELARQTQAGDVHAFDRLVERHAPQVLSFLTQLTGNRHDAEDQTQETFIRAYRSLPRYSPARAFLPWLYAIARRASAQAFRSRRHREDLTDAPPETLTSEDPSCALCQADEVAALWRKARCLSTKQFTALWLRYGEGFELAQVAEAMGTNLIHVKVLLHRARRRLAAWATNR